MCLFNRTDMLMFLSKANNLNQALQSTALRVFMNFSDQHKVHSLFGMIVAIEQQHVDEVVFCNGKVSHY